MKIPECELIGESAFSNCYLLQKVFNRKVKFVAKNAFQQCRELKVFKFNKNLKMSFGSFFRCGFQFLALETFEIPSLCFAENVKLEFVDLLVFKVEESAFAKCNIKCFSNFGSR